MTQALRASVSTDPVGTLELRLLNSVRVQGEAQTAALGLCLCRIVRLLSLLLCQPSRRKVESLLLDEQLGCRFCLLGFDLDDAREARDRLHDEAGHLLPLLGVAGRFELLQLLWLVPGPSHLGSRGVATG